MRENQRLGAPPPPPPEAAVTAGRASTTARNVASVAAGTVMPRTLAGTRAAQR